MLDNLIPHTAEEVALRMIILAAALMLDWLFGEPDMLWRRIPHPVVLFGRAISLGERLGNRKKGRTGLTRRRTGVCAMLVLVLIAGLFGIGLSLGGGLAELVVLTVLLAGRSLDDHIRAVFLALGENIQAAQGAVAMIVGRDTSQMDEADIARAAIETGAENLSDGVIAPAFWFLLIGVPGLLIYKMTNTADSMIGYRNARYRAFGCAAARLDDVMNLVPARLTAILLAGAAAAQEGGTVWEGEGRAQAPAPAARAPGPRAHGRRNVPRRARRRPRARRRDARGAGARPAARAGSHKAHGAPAPRPVCDMQLYMANEVN